MLHAHANHMHTCPHVHAQTYAHTCIHKHINTTHFPPQSNRFMATLSYDVATHHPSHRMRTELKLNDDFKFFVQVVNNDSMNVLIQLIDIQLCSVSIEPAEVAQNRKRRWSKKFPIVVSCPSGPKKFKVYLFSPTARDKEDW